MRAASLFLLAAAAVAQDVSDLTREQLEREFEGYRRTLLDWGGLTRYGSDNAELKPDPRRIVFLGDDLTEQWGEGHRFFPGKPYLNRGIARQTSAQMLVRFRQDVIALKPRAVIIQAGSNDIGRVMGPISELTSAEHITTMAELAKLHGIQVILAAVAPVCDCAGVRQSAIRSLVRIRSLNDWMKSYAEKNGHVFLDYYSALADGRPLRKAYTIDGLRLNEAGYAALEEATEKAIAALR